MEEKLRNYFLSIGFFVVHGIKFTYDGFDVTDIDLWLYNKTSTLTRDRNIVDIKNKRTPQAIERIFWTRGLLTALRVNGCMVATTEKRESIRNFGKMNGVTVLDGNFLNAIANSPENRLTEEEFINKFWVTGEKPISERWVKEYEKIKKSLLTIDYSNVNALIAESKSLFEQVITNPQRRESICRLLYCSLSYMLISFDFLIKDIVTLDESEKKARISEGLKFGNFGRAGIDRTLDLATKIAGQGANVKQNFLRMHESLAVDVLVDFFSNSANSEKCFQQAVSLESNAFLTEFVMPDNLPGGLKGILSVFLDYHGIDRNKFFQSFSD